MYDVGRDVVAVICRRLPRPRGFSSAGACLLVAALGVVTACGPSGSTGPQAPQPAPSSAPAALAPSPSAVAGGLDVVSLVSAPSISNATYYIAKARGYLTEEGIDVEPQVLTTGSDLIAPLSRGDVDVGSTGINSGMFNAAARGIPIHVIADWADVGPGHDYQAIVARKDLVDSGQVKTPADLKGRTIAASSVGSIGQVAVGVMLTNAGLTLDDVNLISMPFADMVTALAGKSVDAAVLIEPLITQVEDQGTAVRFQGFNQIIPNTNIAVLVAGPSLVNRPDVARRFLVALIRGARDYTDAFANGKDKDEIINIIAQGANVPVDVLQRIQTSAVDPNMKVPTASIQFDQQWLGDHGELDAPTGATSLVDDTFVNAAVAQVGAR